MGISSCRLSRLSMRDGQKDRCSHLPSLDATSRAVSHLQPQPANRRCALFAVHTVSARCEHDADDLFQDPAMPKSDERGVALLLALLVLALLVALILEFDTEARREYRDAAAFRDNFKAMVLTRAAVQAARAVLQQDFVKDKQAGKFYDAPTDLWAFPIQQYAIGDGFLSAQIEDERGKLNLNDLAAGGDPNARKSKALRVKRLFELMQVSPELVDAIVDWIDQDEVPEPAGAETLYYQTLHPPYRAANAPLQTLQELRLIKGMTAESFDKISRFVTVDPQEGESRINMNTAESIVLQSLDPRITQAMAGEIIQGRPYKTIQELDRVGSFEAVGQELHDLGGLEERIGRALVAERRLVAAAAASAAERAAAVGRKNRDVIRQPAQPHLQSSQSLHREVNGKMRSEQIGPRDRADHYCTA